MNKDERLKEAIYHLDNAARIIAELGGDDKNLDRCYSLIGAAESRILRVFAEILRV